MENREEISIEIPTIAGVMPSLCSTTDDLVNDAPKICPLCKSEVRLFFINFNDKMLMCENTECEFPFGYEELTFIRESDADDPDTEVDCLSIRTGKSLATPTCSMISNECWNEIDKMTKVYESEDSQSYECKTSEVKKYINRKYVKKLVTADPTQVEIKRNLEQIRELNEKIQERETSKTCIKNEKWIKELMSLQAKSKLSGLVEQEEIELVKPPTKNDIQIDIKPVEGASSMIEIDLKIPENVAPV